MVFRRHRDAGWVEMAYILQGVLGVRGLGDDAHKEALKDAKAVIRAQTGLPAPSGSSSTSQDDGKIFGLPPVLVVAGAAVFGYFGLQYVQKKRAR